MRRLLALLFVLLGLASACAQPARMVPLFASRAPSLDCNFAGVSTANQSARSLFAGPLCPAITISRGDASPAATYFDATGTLQTAAAHVPRIDYSTGSGMFLVEESRTNSITYSVPQADTTNGWSYAANGTLGVTGAATAPDGTLSALSVADTVASSTHYFSNNTAASVTSGSAYTISIFAKASTATVLQMAFDTTSFSATSYANFNLSNGTLGSVGTGTTAVIINVKGGWYRLAITATATASSSNNLFMALVNNNTSAARLSSYTGTGQLAYVWGFDCEAGAFPTTVIPTSGTALTRAADNPSLANVSWLGSNAGTMIVKGYIPYYSTSSNQGLAELDDGTTNNRVAIYHTSGGNNLTGFVASGGSTLMNTTFGSIAAGNTITAGIAWDGGSPIGSMNGAAAVSGSANGSPSGLTTLRLGYSTIGPAASLNGGIQRIVGYARNRNNAQLQGATR